MSSELRANHSIIFRADFHQLRHNGTPSLPQPPQAAAVFLLPISSYPVLIHQIIGQTPPHSSAHLVWLSHHPRKPPHRHTTSFFIESNEFNLASQNCLLPNCSPVCDVSAPRPYDSHIAKDRARSECRWVSVIVSLKLRETIYLDFS